MTITYANVKQFEDYPIIFDMNLQNNEFKSKIYNIKNGWLLKTLIREVTKRKI